jgi:hypothetical protein
MTEFHKLTPLFLMAASKTNSDTCCRWSDSNVTELGHSARVNQHRFEAPLFAVLANTHTGANSRPKGGSVKRVSLGISIVVIAVALYILSIPQHPAQAQSGTVLRAHFNSNGEALLPQGYRQWVHVGTRDNALGKTSILDGKPTTTPEVLDAYVEPHAFAAYQKTGKWPDGSQMVKEFAAVRTGASCQEGTYLCTTEYGEGIFETGYIGLGMMVKDEKRFPSAPGHWAFFSFGHKPPPYDSVSPVRSASQCQSCHIRLASDTDFVISRAHIGLVRAQAH